MNISIPVGLTHTHDYIVQDKDTISAHVDSRLPAVLGTFVLVEWMETVAGLAVQPYLPDGYLTVGARVDIAHLAN